METVICGEQFEFHEFLLSDRLGMGRTYTFCIGQGPLFFVRNVTCLEPNSNVYFLYRAGAVVHVRNVTCLEPNSNSNSSVVIFVKGTTAVPAARTAVSPFGRSPFVIHGLLSAKQKSSLSVAASLAHQLFLLDYFRHGKDSWEGRGGVRIFVPANITPPWP